MERILPEPTAEALDAIGAGRFPGFVGLRITAASYGAISAELDVAEHHLAPNGYLHAGVVATLGDTACGYGARTAMPDDAVGFTTVELKTNFLGTALDGRITCEARMAHGGRTTQVWDATIRQQERVLAMFRCTQLLLYPKPGSD